MSVSLVPGFNLVGDLTADAWGAAPAAAAVIHGCARNLVFVPDIGPQHGDGDAWAEERQDAIEATVLMQTVCTLTHLAREAKGPEKA